jgi:hypothetical protein
MNKISKINQFKASKQAERKMLASKMDWHLRRISEAHASATRIWSNVLRHELAIQDCELKLHQLKKFV